MRIRSVYRFFMNLLSSTCDSCDQEDPVEHTMHPIGEESDSQSECHEGEVSISYVMTSRTREASYKEYYDRRTYPGVHAFVRSIL